MLRQIEECGADACCIDAGTRAQAGNKGPQRNILADYLRMISLNFIASSLIFFG